MAILVIKPSGGNWQDGTAFIGGAIPTASDDVVGISTSGNLNLLSTNVSCKSLDLSASASYLITASGLNITTYGTTLDGYSIKLNNIGNWNGTNGGIFLIYSPSSKVYFGNRRIYELRVGSAVGLLNLDTDLYCSYQITFSTGSNGIFNTNNHYVETRLFSFTNASPTLNLGTSQVSFTSPTGISNDCFKVSSSGNPIINGTGSFIFVQTYNYGRYLNSTTYGTYYFGTVYFGTPNNPMYIGKTCSIELLYLIPSTHIIFSSGKTYTIKDINALGSVDSVINMSTSSTGTVTIIKPSGIVKDCDWLNINNVIADSSTLWYAGSNSVGNANSTGWLFEDYVPPPPYLSGGNMMLGFVC